ncbi:unnamed protein product, partial [Staurois parvus]
MTLGRKGLTSGVIKRLTVCGVCFTMCAVCCFTWETCCFVFLCCVEKYKATCPGLSPVSFADDHQVPAGNRWPGPG